jgi:curved DNA-binding protein CbpA
MGQGQSSKSYEQYYQTLQQNQTIPTDVDPYEVLGVSKNYTWDELVSAYRRVAKLVHPDKGGSEILFHTVTDCFKKLAYEYKLKEADKPHHVLKQNFNTQEKFNEYKPASTFLESASFHDKFNKMFEENKLDDEERDFGYGHMMEKSDPSRGDIDIPKTIDKFSQKRFNAMFDKQVTPGKDVIIYKEPEPMLLAKKLNFTELGGTTEDYSTDPSKKTSLQYTDYMKAHTTTRLVDPRSVKERKHYKTVKDYEADRAAATEKVMDESELRYQHEMKEYKRRQEEERIRRLEKRDEIASKHHDKVNQLFLGIR